RNQKPKTRNQKPETRNLINDLPRRLIAVQLLASVVIYRMLSLRRVHVFWGTAQLGGKVPLARVTDHRDDPLHLRMLLGHLQRRYNIRPRGDAAEDSFLFGQTPGHFESLFGLDGHYAVQETQIQVSRNEPVPDSFDLMLSPFAPRQQRTLRRLSSVEPYSTSLLPEISPDPG